MNAPVNAENENVSEEASGESAGAGGGDASPPNDRKLEGVDNETKALLDRFARTHGRLDLEKEIRAGRLAQESGVPMKAANMAERIAQAAAEGRAINLAPATLPALPTATRTRPAPARGPGPAAAPAPAAAAPAPAPPAAAAGAPAADKPVTLIEVVATLNRHRVRPPGLFPEAEEYQRRIALAFTHRGAIRDGNNDVLVPAQGAVVLEGRIPEGVGLDIPIVELRRLLFHPFGLDRLLVAGISVDGVQISGQGPAQFFARHDACPTALMTATSVLSIRLRNLTSGPSPYALSAVVVPLMQVSDAEVG